MINYQQKNYHRFKVEPLKNPTIAKIGGAKRRKGNEKITSINLEPYRGMSSNQKVSQSHEKSFYQHSKLQKYNVEKKKRNSKVAVVPSAQIDLALQKSLIFLKLDMQNTQEDGWMNSLKKFFKNILRNEDGCTCNSPCVYAMQLVHWANVSEQLTLDHYQSYLAQIPELKNKESDDIWQPPSWKSERQIVSHSTEKQCNRTLKLSSRVNNRQSKNQYGRESMLKAQVNYAYYNTQGKTYSRLHQKRKQQQRKLALKTFDAKATLVQIQKDVDRTQPYCEAFRKQDFKIKLTNILIIYAMEDPQVGYVQGMNMILSGLLYHIKDEFNTYNVFRKLLSDIRNIYLDNFNECFKHVKKIHGYLQKYSPEFSKHLAKIGVDLKMVCLPWILSLLTSLVPLDYLHEIYIGFVKSKWQFVYRMVLSILAYHKEEINAMDDLGDVLVLLSCTNDRQLGKDWQAIIVFANDLVL